MTASSPAQEQPAIRIIAMPADANYYGDVFGGWLMNMMDLAASSVASRESGGRAVTVAIDAVSFHHPVHIGDEVSVYARLASTGRTSMKIVVEAWQRALSGETSTRVTEATFTFVAVDQSGKPRPLAARPA
ncbi:MAG TPA: acyl-CoA thioesterase [Rhizomicrobium sp.]|jgi:acyl-CoA thioesterase YciA|nr:acyl-CoA thioesterase [Rhizomicrobium sp.]